MVFTGPESGSTATSATITLSATADSAVESTAETVVIGLGSITNTGLTGAGGVSETDNLGDFSISDAPPTGLAITETADDTTVSEDGTTTDTYTVALKTEPTHDVTVDGHRQHRCPGGSGWCSSSHHQPDVHHQQLQHGPDGDSHRCG